MKTGVLVAGVVAGVATAFAAFAQGGELNAEQAQQVTETRQGLLKVVGWNMGPIGGVLRGNAPYDAATVATSAERIAQLGAMIPDAFAADTTAFELETEALAEIWANKDDFDAKAAALVDAATALQATAAEGGEEAPRGAMLAVAQSCGACHDSYRAD